MMGLWQQHQRRHSTNLSWNNAEFPFAPSMEESNTGRAGDEREESSPFRDRWLPALTGHETMTHRLETSSSTLTASLSYEEGDVPQEAAHLLHSTFQDPRVNHQTEAVKEEADDRKLPAAPTVNEPNQPSLWASSSFESAHGRPAPSLDDDNIVTTAHDEFDNAAYPSYLAEPSSLEETSLLSGPGVHPPPPPRALVPRALPRASNRGMTTRMLFSEPEAAQVPENNEVQMLVAPQKKTKQMKKPASARHRVKAAKPQTAAALILQAAAATAVTSVTASSESPAAPEALNPTTESVDLFNPSEEEIGACANSRKLKALETFYTRMKELHEYKETHGDTNVPQKYSPRPQLGVWVNKTRMEYKKLQKGESSSLDATRVNKLSLMGFDWGGDKGDLKWNHHFSALQDFVATHGHADVPTKYSKNPALGRWVSTQRCQYRLLKAKKKSLLNEAKVGRLDSVGFVWDMTKAKKRGHSA